MTGNSICDLAGQRFIPFQRSDTMKKTGYTVINNPLDDYDLSFRRCHAAEIGAYIIGLTVFILIYFLVVCTGEGGHGREYLREDLIYPLSFSLPLFLLGLSMTVRIGRVKKIMANGKATEGEVISYRRVHVTHGRRSRLIHEPNHTLLNIRFNDGGERECTVSVWRRLPEQVLASPRCTVYILDDKVFVTGFTLRKKGDPQPSP